MINSTHLLKQAPVLKLTLAVTLVCLLGGCTLFQNLFENEESRTEREATRLLDTDGEAKRSWYCYGKNESEWDCRNEPEPGLAKAITPKPPEPFSPLDDEPATPASAPPSVPIVTDEPAQPVDEPFVTGNAIMDAPEDYYTVQLIALKGEADVLAFATTNGIAEPMYTRTVSDGESYYILLLGIYPTLAEARKAQEEWEATKALKVEPWVRRIGPLQQSARTAAAEA